jgi:tetratricopeptide (TPR) repeat protein
MHSMMAITEVYKTLVQPDRSRYNPSRLFMADSQRLESKTSTDASRADSAAVAAEIEALLVEGLDRYFARQYEDAIHVWTRVLFLDRIHPRARAYIDRARSALMERERRGDEMLQTSHDLLDRGETDAARAMLQDALAHGADDERAAALWLKVERRERTRATAFIGADPVREHEAPVSGWEWRRSSRWAVALLALAVAGVLGDFASRVWFAPGSTADAAVAKADRVAPVVLSSGDVAIVRARTLYARGQLAEALQALDRVPPTGPKRAEADTMRREIQRLLLATSQVRSPQVPGPHP